MELVEWLHARDLAILRFPASASAPLTYRYYLIPNSVLLNKGNISEGRETYGFSD